MNSSYLSLFLHLSFFFFFLKFDSVSILPSGTEFWQQTQTVLQPVQNVAELETFSL